MKKYLASLGDEYKELKFIDLSKVLEKAKP